MVEKLKERINIEKNDKSFLKKYVNVFCEMEKSNDLFKQSSEFKKLKDHVQKNK